VTGLLSLLAVLALVVAGCGGGGGGGDSKDARALIDDAFKQSITSADIALAIEAKVDGVAQLQDPVSLKISGPYQSNGKSKLPSLKWDVSVSGGGQAISGGITSTGDNAFVNFQGSDYEVGADKVGQLNQQLATQSGQNKTLSDYGINPQDWVTSPTEEGDENVNGVDTTHVKAGVDIKKMLTDFNKTIQQTSGAMGSSAPQQLTPEQIDKVSQFIKEPKFELWVGKDDKKIRRMVVDVNFDIPEDQRTQLQGATGGSFKFSIDFKKVGEQQSITAPANPKPLSELQQQLGGLGGAMPGLGG
jgi:hypothetical protein